MQYVHEASGTTFTIPDRITVRQQLAFRSRVAEGAGESSFARYWLAAPMVMEGWQSALVPDAAALDLDAADDPRIADLVAWVANAVAGHLLALDTPGKAS